MKNWQAPRPEFAAIVAAMAGWGRWLAISALGIAGLGLGLGLSVRRANACGGVFVPQAKRLPSLAHEQVLILHDPNTDTEHFIREVAFRQADQRFGFVVPTPTRPEVAKVDRGLFEKLRRQFPFQRSKGIGSIGLGSGAGVGFGSGRSAGVQVLQVSKVGSFTAFVLAATDAKALSKWLKDNGLASSKETDVWLAHYVKMKFYYVAMRYDPPKGAFYLWVPAPKGFTSASFCDHMLETCAVVLAPGAGYGVNGEGFVRFSLTVSDARLDEALARMRDKLSPFSF